MFLRTKIAVATLISFIAFGFTGPEGQTTSYSVDQENSTIEWRAEKVTGFHTGTIAVKEGNFEFTEGQLTGGEFVIDMTSIANTDIGNADMAAKLVGHLKSPDFFGVESFPTASFVIKNVVSRGTAGSYKIVGDITIKKTTKEIKFNANVSEEGGKVTAKADLTLDRSEFDIRYGSGSFFENLGDKTIYDEFTLSLNLTGAAS